ncbi:MAG: hypothetical protein K9J74_04945 [Sulfuritalea sp.]|nr:hypothetical protein [Sulfuritalea sp.]
MHTSAVARESDIAFRFNHVSFLPVGYPVAIENRVPLADFDTALGEHFDIGGAGDVVGSNESRQLFVRLYQMRQDAGRAAQSGFRQISSRDVRRIERRKCRTLCDQRRFLGLLDRRDG